MNELFGSLTTYEMMTVVLKLLREWPPSYQPRK